MYLSRRVDLSNSCWTIEPDAGRGYLGHMPMRRRRVKKRAVSVLPKSYGAVLEAVKARIRAAQLQAARSVNQELVSLYWQIGREIIQRQDKEGWGSKVVERLAKDLHKEFPDMGGFSARICYTCVPSPRHIPPPQLSNSLLDKFHGGTTCCCSPS